jgi:phage/plasmid-like protein (TIGR03299 family)
MTDAVETMMYNQKPPWHGLGIYVGDEPLLSKDAIIKAGLDWEVEKQEIYASQDKIHSQIIPTHKAVVRTADQQILGIVGNRYQPIQNLEAFDFMDSLVEDGDMRYHTAGSLYGGQKIWLLGKISETEILPQDKIDHYLFLYNSHDGSSSLRVVFTTIRVVCANTAQVALRQAAGEGVKVRHTKNLREKIQQAKGVLGIAHKGFQDFDAWAKGAVRTQLTANQWNKVLEKVVPMPPPHLITKKAETMRQNVRDNISQLYYDGTGQDIPGVAGTGWAAYNAVVEYSNYQRKARGGDHQAKRFEASLFGGGNKMIQRTMREVSRIAA